MTAVQAVDMLTIQSVKGHASDIHMVPSSDSSRVLFRLDGELKEMVVLPLTLHESMVSRIKVQAGMDISETRRPQDGSFSLMFGERKAEFRVSTVGTGWGEMKDRYAKKLRGTCTARRYAGRLKWPSR